MFWSNELRVLRLIPKAIKCLFTLNEYSDWYIVQDNLLIVLEYCKTVQCSVHCTVHLYITHTHCKRYAYEDRRSCVINKIRGKLIKDCNTNKLAQYLFSI